MFLLLVFPIVDVRDFLNNHTGKLLVPTWPLPREEKEFVRYTGIVRRRPGGGTIDWSGEDVFADAARAVRYVDLPRRTFDFGDCFGTPLGRYRRFFSNGITNRFELGIKIPIPDELHLDQKTLFSFLNELLSIPMTIPIPMNTRKTMEIASLASSLAKLYLIASSSQPKQYKSELKNGWQVMAGNPMILVFNQEKLKIDVPEYANSLEPFKDCDIVLNHFWIKKNSVPMRVWIINSSSKKNAEITRRLKISLIRVHEEKECLKEVLRLIGQEKIPITVGTQASDNLQAYLNESIRIINRKTNEGIPQSEILSSVFDSEKIVNEGEQKTIETQLANIRKNVLNKVKVFTDANAQSMKEKKVTNITITTGDGSPVTLTDVIIAENIQKT